MCGLCDVFNVGAVVPAKKEEKLGQPSTRTFQLRFMETPSTINEVNTDLSKISSRDAVCHHSHRLDMGLFSVLISRMQPEKRDAHTFW
jgi:hypothetical protein